MYSYSMGDMLFDMLIFLIIAAVVVWFVQRSRSKKDTTAVPSKTTQPYLNKQQIAQDIKSTQTSRIVDAVGILDELGATTKDYRHYCELVGTSMQEGGVMAPYSKRQVAYYDLRCYRIENIEGRDVETLVAQERSVDQFWFTDGSGGPNVYVDLASFGNNCILVNMTNRVEGPSSDFAKAMAGATSSANASAYGRGVNAAYDQRHGGPGGPGRPGGPQNGRIYGGFGGYGLPSDLDSFLGGALSGGHMGGYGGPRFRNTGDDIVGTMLNIGLGALVGSLTTTTQTTGAQQTGPTTSFRGYRIIEDVVPLGSPIYALGEIYRHGTDVFIGRSVSETYASSYFACKPEAEVLNALK